MLNCQATKTRVCGTSPYPATAQCLGPPRAALFSTETWVEGTLAAYRQAVAR